jgi:hypothetical protein
MVSGEHEFWRGIARITSGGFSNTLSCRVFLDSSPEKELRIEAPNELGLAALRYISADQTSIEIPGVAEPLGIFLSNMRTSPEGQDLLTFAVARSPIWVTKSQALISAKTMLVNFAQYRCFKNLDFEVLGAGWRVSFQPVSDAAQEPMQSDKYRITHQVEFARETGASFSPSEAQHFLDNLHYFLSFCRGEWVATAFTVAIGQDGKVGMEQWGTGRVSPWRDPSSWLDRHHGSPIIELFRPFCDKLADPGWRDAISQVVYWFQRAKTDTAGADGACILLQASLERFAWHLLVRQDRSLSEKEFNKLSAARRLRWMLNSLSIPTAVPEGLRNLSKYAEAKKLDGPEAFTFIRNRLVHPPKPSAVKEEALHYEAYSLAKWYIELAVLSVCGFRGEYSNRTRAHRWVGQVEKVPWA